MKRLNSHFCLVLLLSAWISGVAIDAHAQGAKRIVISTAAGGGLDSLMRNLSNTQTLRSSWGNPILTENRPGQNGLVATEFARGLRGDGSVMLAVLVTESGVNAAAFAPTLTALAEFVPIAYLGSVTGPNGKSWFGVYGPPGMSGDAARRLETVVQTAMQEGEVAALTATFTGWQQDRVVSAATLAQLTGSSTGTRAGAQASEQPAGPARGSGQTAPITTGDSAACRCLTVSADPAGEIIRNTCSREVVAFVCVDGYNCRGETHISVGGLGPKGSTGSNLDHQRVQNSNRGSRQRWGYGAEFKEVVVARKALSARWPEVQSNRWVCSENRDPVIIPWRVNQAPGMSVYAMHQH